jgi:hypothetical protein
MEKNIINKIKLMMSYEMGKTLTENKITNNIIDENDAEIVEQGVAVKDLVKAGKIGADLKAGLKDLAVGAIKDNNAILIKDAKGKLVAAQTGDDILNAIKKGTINAQELAKVNFGLFKSVGTSQNTLKLLATDIIESPKFMKEYMSKWKPNKPEELKKILKGRGYSESGAEALISKIESNKLWAEIKSGKAAVRDAKATAKNTVKDTKAAGGNVTVNVNQTVGGASGNLTKAAEDAVAAGDNKIKEILDDAKKLPDTKPTRWERWKAWGERNPKSKKLLYLLGFGGATYAAYKMLFSDTTPEQAKQLTFSNCAGSLVDDAGTTIKTTTGGDPVLKVTKTGNQEYDSKGGLMFYNNGRVFMVDQSKRGYWSCKGNTVIAESQLLNEGEIDAETFNDYIDDIGTYLARYVTEYNLKAVKEILLKIKGNTFEGKNAMSEFLRYYKMKQESDFVDDVNSVGVKTFIVTGTKLKQEIIQIATSTSGVASGGDGKSATGVDSIINIKWDGAKTGGGDGGSGGGDGGKKTTKYYDCASVNLDTTPLTYGCKDPRIAQIQGCLGVTPDGKFGPVTRKSLLDDGFDVKNGITKDIFNKVLSMCKTSKVGEMSDEDKARVNYLKNPIKMDLGPVPQIPTKKTSATSSQGMTDAQFYQSFVDSGLITRNLIGRIVYKGQVLEPEEKSKLDNQMASMGYSPTREAATDEGERYVWKRD